MKKVIVGMSGGVDSSVAAILLKEAGYEVEGLFMRNWDSVLNHDILGNPKYTNNICPQEVDYQDALSVCQKINIPLHRVEFVEEYWDNVFTYFLDELKKGRTPNPDIMCNKFIKFDAFIKEAENLGADYIATGHYARIDKGKLLRGIDQNKDQTYFLSQLTKKQLSKVLFPVGNLTKSEVRAIAEKRALVTAKKKDSTGICFIGERNFVNFLKNYLPNKPGKIIDIDTNQVLGSHIGLMYYTIGQRKGLNIGGSFNKIFVVGKDLKNNYLLVAHGSENKYLYSDEALIDTVNWLGDTKIKEVTVKFRYRQKDINATLDFLENDKVMVKYSNPVMAVTPGQACVFYKQEECLGGGLIKEVYRSGKRLEYL